MERRRSGRGGWGRDLGIFSLSTAQIGAKNREKPSNLVGLTGVLSRNSLEENGLRRYRGLWDLRALVSVSGAICGRKPRCAARSRDAAGGSGACLQRAFHTFPSAVAHRDCGSSLDSWPAIADWTSAFALGDTLAGHRSSGADQAAGRGETNHGRKDTFASRTYVSPPGNSGKRNKLKRQESKREK